MFDLNSFREAIRLENFEWRKHVLLRLAERGIRQQEVLNALLEGELIREYANDKPFPSALFLFQKDRPLHVVAAFDAKNRFGYIVTAYEPSPDVFEADLKTRKP